MKGKVGLVIGLGVGYVLGTRAGRERYEQLKEQAAKVWELDAVQQQVDKVKDLGKTAAMALPKTVWDSAVKVTKAASKKGTAGQRLDAAVAEAKDSADDIAKAAETSADEVKKSVKREADDISTADI